MASMDERTKAELYKINQEKFFLSVIVITVFLIIKINLKAGILGMLGEITAAAIIIFYLFPYFIIRYKYKIIDEMVKNKLYKLSAVFFILEMLSLLPVMIIDLSFILNRINNLDGNSKPIQIMDSSFPFAITLGFIINAYGLIRMHNEKFLSEKAAKTNFITYKKKLLKKTIIASFIIAALITAFVLINNYVNQKIKNHDSESFQFWSFLLDIGILLSILGIPTCWLFYFYYSSMRKHLTKELQNTDEQENLNSNEKKRNC